MNQKLASLSDKLDAKRKELKILEAEVSDLYGKFKSEKEKQWLIDNVEVSIEEALAYDYTEIGHKQKKKDWL